MYGFNDDKTKAGAFPADRMVTVSGTVSFAQFSKESDDLWYVPSATAKGYTGFVILGISVKAPNGVWLSQPFPTGINAFQVGFESLAVAIGSDNGSFINLGFYRVSDNLPTVNSREVRIVGMYW